MPCGRESDQHAALSRGGKSESRFRGEVNMGMCLDSTPAMGEWSTEVRRESFYLRGPMEAYPSDFSGGGTAEILLTDIPKIRAALDQVEEYLRAR